VRSFKSRPLGNGKWRVMGGYEIQNLSYKTFEGVEAEAINQLPKTTAPNGFPFTKDFDQGEISGLNGGWISIIQTAYL
jgi:hypothetical protein